MDRSQEKSALLSTKVHSLDAKTANARQQFAHEAVTTNPIFRQLKAFPSQATLENGSKPAGFSSSEVAIGRNSDQFISPLQAQYYSQTVPSAALGMSLPYVGGMITGQGMDPRALNAGNLLYTYGNPVMSFPNFSAGYGQGQRVKNSEETASDKTTNSSSQLRPTEPPSRSSKEPMRTESVIKTVTDKQEAAKKSGDTDKRNPADTQASNVPLRYPDRGKGSELGNSDDAKNKGLSLRDTQSNDDMSRRDKQSIVGDYDRTRDKLQKAKTFEHLPVDASGNKRPSNGLASRMVENGAVTFSSHEKSYTTSEARSSPYLAHEPPTLVPYHNPLPSRTSSSTTQLNVPSTMPKLTPIAPRISNGSPLTVPYSSEGSSSYAAWRQNYSYPMNSVSSAPSVTSYSGVGPWTTNYPSKQPQVRDKAEEDNWRTKQLPREERDINRTSGYEHAQNLVARSYYPLESNERLAYYGALPPQLRAAGAEKSFGGKDVEDDSRDVSRDSSREGMPLSEQAKLSKGALKFGVGQGSLRKEPDISSSKMSITGSHEDYKRSQPFVNRNEKSVVGEYVKDYTNKSDDGKGSLAGNVIVHSKESGPYRLSVEKRDGNQKYKYPEMSKSSRVEENRPTSGSYGSYDNREQSETNFMGVPRAELRSNVREDKEMESADRTRPIDPTRSNDQSLYREHAGRKPDSRDIPTAGDGKKSNDRNNNSTAYGAFPFFKYGQGGFPSVANGDQMRYVERSGAVSDDKVFVPPNATIEMYERREQEMEKNGLRKTDFNAFARNIESGRMSNSADEGTKRNDERRGAPTQDEAKSKLPTGRFENEKRSETEEISSDENDDAVRHVSRESLSPDKRSQLRPPQSSDRTVVSPAAGAVRQRRLSSPLSDQRNTSASNPYGASLGPGLHSRRTATDSSEGHSRDSAGESGLSGLGNPGPAQFLRMDGAGFNPYFAPMFAAPQGMPEAPFMLVDPSSIYGTMYRPPLIETAPPGMFPSGALAADPITGQIMMIPPEAYIPMVAAENTAFMNPIMDPRYAGMWGVPGAFDEAQWQQVYQMMQPFQQQHKQQQPQSQQQQQQIHERSKQFFLSKQGTPFPFSGYPPYYGDKHFDQQHKGESKEGRPADQQQRTREETQENSESQAQEPASRIKTEAVAPQDHVQRVPASRESASRDTEFVQQQETVNQREEKSANESRRLKEAHQKLTEKQSAIQEKLGAQGDIAKKLKDYLSRETFFQFPFPGSQAPFSRDMPRVNLTVPTTTASSRTPEVERNSASPKTVSAAVTLSGMEKARGEDHQWSTRSTTPAKSDTLVIGSQDSVVDRVKSPRLWATGAESVITKEIVETPRRLEAQPNLLGERVVSRESREVATGQVPLQFPQKLMAFENVASERPVQMKPERETERERLESYYRAYDRGLPVSFNEVTCNASDKTVASGLETHLARREQSHTVDSYGEVMNSFVKSAIERTERGLQPANVRLRENLDSLEDNRGNFQAVVSHERPPPPDGFDSDSEFEDDFNTKCELRRIASSFVPLKTDLENKENSTIFSLRPFRSEAERKQIRENIDRLRSMAKRRSSKDRFMVFSRRRDLRSPTTILNSVTSAISDVAGVESVEKEMRMKLAELQKKYREKVRELARLQPKYGADDGTGKSTPIKRGPGRPRKRKYFGASSKGDKSSPVLTTGFNKEGEESLPVSEAQSPELNAVASESESLVSKDSEPPKKKKKKNKQKSPVEREERGSAPSSRGPSPVESADFSVPVGKKKKSRKTTPVEEEPPVAPSKDKPTNMKKKGPGKRRKGSPTEDSPNQQTVPQPPAAISEISTNELDNNAEFTEPKNATKSTKVKKQKPKKRARPKLTIETPEGYDDEKPDGEVTPNSSDRTCETPRAPSPIKGKKTKGSKKKRKSTPATPPKAKFEFPEVTSQDDSFSENSSVSPNDIAKEVAMAARKELEAQRNSRVASSDVDDDVFTPTHDGRDGLNLLAQASFASVDKPTKRKRSEAVSPSEEKKRGRPKKPSESPPYEPDVPVAPKKKKKKKVTEEDSVKEPKKKKKKKKKDSAPKEEKIEEKPAEAPPEQPDPEPLPMEQHEELDSKKLPDASTVTADSEQDEEVFRPAAEQTKEGRAAKSDASTPREGDEFKGSVSSLLSEEWQPRRSERIFINSSVTTSSGSSPLSPTGKGSEFSYTKKPKRASVTKGKPNRSGSLGEEEQEESDVIPQKPKAKAKKKKGLGKGRKRSSSTAADFDEYEPSKLTRRARSKSRQTIDYDDAEEEEAEDVQEEEEPHEEGETDVEINVTDKMESNEEPAEVPAPPDVSAESGSDVKPETEVEPMETEKNDIKEVADVEMTEDQETEEVNVTEEKGEVEEAEKSEEKESKEEPAENEEKKEKEEAFFEHPPSPVDVRFTFVIDELVEGVKLLLPVDSVFYPGRISTFNEPDLFGVILDGERGRRPHWKSTEQLLNEAVKDIQPPGAKFLAIGTRVCAHWSPQYRCFYPGTVTEAPSDEKEVNGKIWIEFDDGDSGFFQLNEIKRIHPDFPVEDLESTPSLPEKRPRSSSLGGASQSTAPKDSKLRLRAGENASEFSSGNESSGEVQTKKRRLRGKRKSKDDSWLPSKHLANITKESGTSKGGTFRSKTKEVEKSSSEDTGSLTRAKDKSQGGNDSQESKVTDAPKQKANRVRGKTETKVENKEAPPRTAENTKQDLATVASAELKESEKEIHSSDSSIKTESFDNNSKQSSEKTRAALDNTTESSDQGDDSEATSDVETSKHEKGPRAGSKGSSRTSEKDLRRRSLNLSLTSSFRSSRAEGESPTRDVLSTSQDEDSESYSDAFDESPLVESKPFQPRLGRRRRSELDRLQVDMKCSGPLWQWSGRSFQNKRKGKGKKSFYKAIVRGDETICVGDCAVFTSNPTKNLNLPYVGKIESMWEGCVGNMVVRVKWFYHPEETKPGRKPSDGKQSLYRSTHVDENDVQTISHKCEVLTPEEFKKRSQSLDTPSAKNRVFCCIGSYDPNNETLSTEL